MTHAPTLARARPIHTIGLFCSVLFTTTSWASTPSNNTIIAGWTPLEPPAMPQNVAYSPPRPFNNEVCNSRNAEILLNNCLRTNYSRNGLLDLNSFLQNQRKTARSPAYQLLQTVQSFINWHDSALAGYLADNFVLKPISSARFGGGNGDFTGYFTPELRASRIRTAQYTVPIYRMPKGNTAKNLTHVAIASGALANKGLEIAWTDDPFQLYVAQVQGSALLYFPDGSRTMLDYAGSNNFGFRSVSDYMKSRGYRPRSFSNDDMRAWLLQHQDKTFEALTSNPRYVFFRDTGETPETASGKDVIPGHTVAVDSNYIPHGSILLAELPRLNAAGEAVGMEWRLLFAQDHGKAIKGDGRFDLYTGLGKAGEKRAYTISGARRVFQLLSKPTTNQNYARL